MFDQLSKRLFKWRPSLDGVEVVEQQFDAPTKAAIGAAAAASTATGAAIGSITMVTSGRTQTVEDELEQPPRD